MTKITYEYVKSLNTIFIYHQSTFEPVGNLLSKEECETYILSDPTIVIKDLTIYEKVALNENLSVQ